MVFAGRLTDEVADARMAARLSGGAIPARVDDELWLLERTSRTLNGLLDRMSRQGLDGAGQIDDCTAVEISRLLQDERALRRHLAARCGVVWPDRD